MAVLFSAINAHKNIEWFRKSVREVRVFSVEDWSDFHNSLRSDISIWTDSFGGTENM